MIRNVSPMQNNDTLIPINHQNLDCLRNNGPLCMHFAHKGSDVHNLRFDDFIEAKSQKMLIVVKNLLT